jgi:RimJ/RimL family protein N-acetyltransferase
MIGFRKLERRDLPLMHRWLNTPHVAQWWPDEALALDQIVARYTPRIDGLEDVRCFVIAHGDTPIGYIQVSPVDERSVGIDLLIGEVEFYHRGLGASIIRKFLGRVVFADPAIENCVIDPTVSNRGAIRAYEKAGFRYFETVVEPGEPEPHHMMRIARKDFESLGCK